MIYTYFKRCDLWKEWFVFYEQYKAIWTIVSFVFLYYQKTIYILLLDVKSFCRKTYLIALHLIVRFILEIVDCVYVDDVV
jgi:hypothetical protein